MCDRHVVAWLGERLAEASVSKENGKRRRTYGDALVYSGEIVQLVKSGRELRALERQSRDSSSFFERRDTAVANAREEATRNARLSKPGERYIRL